MIRWFFLVALFVLIEYYSFQAFRTVFRSRWVPWGILALTTAVYIYIIYQFSQFDRSVGQNRTSLITAGLLLITLIPKLVIVLVLFIEDVYRLPAGLVHLINHREATDHIPSRRKFVSTVALGLAAVPLISLLYGMFKGKYDFRVIRQPVYFDDLPDEFDGFTITQISDIHSGSFDNREKIEYAVDLINQQQSDLIVFTGDIVNTHAREMYPWIETFNRIENPRHGKFSILGNHDYGEYLEWKSQQQKAANFEAIKDLHRQIGFRLLLNENVRITKGDSSIALVGVENWGHNFKKAGDLALASEGIAQTDFKVLLSHDPSHWEYEVKRHPGNFHLTLSGHTHGMQFGIEIPGVVKWSPVQYVYKQWAGLYEELGRYIYVNRGLGFHAYPGRVGIWPEITVLELKKRLKNA